MSPVPARKHRRARDRPGLSIRPFVLNILESNMSLTKNSRGSGKSPFLKAAHRFQDALAALAAGAGAIPFGDNGRLFRDLAELRRERQMHRGCDG